MTKYIGLCGRMGSGKDTAARALVRNGYTRIAFADALRQMAEKLDPIVVASHGKKGIGSSRELPVTWLNRLSKLVAAVGWDEAKKSSDVRHFLQFLGTDVVREIDKDYWVKKAWEKASEIIQFNNATGLPDPKFVFTDVRFGNEADFIWAKGGVLVYIDRTMPLIEEARKHSSEAFDGAKYADHIIHNDGSIEDLEAEILEFVGLNLEQVVS